jgi:azurin
MKKSMLFLTVGAGLLLAVSTSRLLAADDSSKEVTITGTMVCGKCVLHETKSCQNVVQVTQDGKTINYYLKQNDVSKDAHKPICGGGSEKVTVTGTVKEKDGKEFMTPTKIDEVKS